MKNLRKIIFAYGLIWTLILIAGICLILNQDPPQEIKVEEYKLEVEMDKSCYEQLQNNMDGAIYVKLYFKEW